MEMKQNEARSKDGGIRKHVHFLLMGLCCLMPIVAIVVLRAIGVQNGFWYFAAVLICPLSMVMMMLSMHRKGDDNGGHQH